MLSVHEENIHSFDRHRAHGGATVSQQTLDNFNSAFQDESNASHRYEAFAKKADTEGYA